VKPRHPAFPAQWSYGLCRALLGERCTLAPVALRLTMRAPGRAAASPQRLTPACGRQDHTILPYADHTGRARDAFAHGCPPCEAFRADVTHVHRRPARVRDDRDTPLFLGPECEMSNKNPNSNKEKYFSACLLARAWVFCPTSCTRGCCGNGHSGAIGTRGFCARAGAGLTVAGVAPLLVRSRRSASGAALSA